MNREVLTLDLRGLEPPQPMVRILEAVENLPPDVELHARTDRRPVHLLAQLHQRGLVVESEPHPDGGQLTRICRRA